MELSLDLMLGQITYSLQTNVWLSRHGQEERGFVGCGLHLSTAGNIDRGGLQSEPPPAPLLASITVFKIHINLIRCFPPAFHEKICICTARSRSALPGEEVGRALSREEGSSPGDET